MQSNSCTYTLADQLINQKIGIVLQIPKFLCLQYHVPFKNTGSTPANAIAARIFLANLLKSENFRRNHHEMLGG